MPKILIAGSNGLIASKIIQYFSRFENWEIIATSRSPIRWKLPSGCKFELLDITNSTEVAYLLDLYSPDVIVNTAAITKPDDCEKDSTSAWKINCDAAKQLADECKKRSCFLIHFSTDFVFDGTEAFYTETSIPNPLSTYARTKLAADEYIMDTLDDYSIVRTSLVYGIAPAQGRSNLMSWVKNSLSEGKAIKVVSDQFRTPTLDEDIAKAVHTIAEKYFTGIINLSGTDYLSVYEIAVRTAELFGLDTKLISPIATIELNEPAVRPRKTYLKTDKAVTQLQYCPTAFHEGLQFLKDQL